MASFGEKLRREREVRGASLRELAERTKISVRFLRALEEDRIDVLPGGLFPKAFVKQYATALGLDPVKLSEEFAAAHGTPAAPERRIVGIERRPRFSASQVLFGVVAVVAVGLALRHVASNPDRDRDTTTVSPVSAAPAVLPTDRVYPIAARRPAAEAADGIVLWLKAEQECWVEVRADGETKMNRVLAPGETETLEARGEIVLSVGNAGGLQVHVNDRPALPLGRNGEVRKNIVITPQSLPALVDQDPPAARVGGRG